MIMTITTDQKGIRKLIIGDNAQFHIPIYQRIYTWKAKEQVKKLLEDIIEFGEEYKGNLKAEYYIGNVIFKNQIRGFQEERAVIDGQQRITTTILILCAIRDIFLHKTKTDEAKLAAKNIGRALFSDNDGVIKLKLNNMEHQSTLSTILMGDLEAITATDKLTNYWENYSYIYKQLALMDQPQLENFVEILDRVKVVAIFLDDAQDENSVFESINVGGKPLSGPDLIKNYIFTFKNYQCTHNEEKLLIDLYTKKFESLFSSEKEIENELEKFFRQYIAIKSYELVNQNAKVIYYSFKKLIGEISSYDECKKLIVDIAKYGLIYQALRIGNHPDIDSNHLGYIRSSFLTYSTLLMDVVDKSSVVDGGSIVITEKVRLNLTLKKIVAYDVSRLLAGLPTKEITRFIASIPKKLTQQNPEYYIEYPSAFEDLVKFSSEGYAQPTLNYLFSTTPEIDFYNRKKNQIKRFMILLENIDKKELLSFEKDFDGCQIEHILPQTLTPEWTISNEDHERYVHSLGNLSISLDNQAIINKSFSDKKNLLNQKSRITLNGMLNKYEKFDAQTIMDRSRALLEIFAKAYGLELNSELEIYKKSNSTEKNIFDIGDPTGKKLDYAIFLDEKIEVREISKLYVEIFKRLFAIDNDLLLDSEIANQIKLSNDSNFNVISPSELDQGYSIETCYNNVDKFKKIKHALVIFGLENKLSIKFLPTIDTGKLLDELNQL